MKKWLLSMVMCGWLSQSLFAQEEIKISILGEADRITVVERLNQRTILVGVIEEQALFVIDLATQAVQAKIALGFEPLVVVYDPKTNLAYVGGVNNSSLAVIDLDKKEIIADIDLKAGVYDLALNSDLNLLVATHPASKRISLIDLKTRQARAIEMPQPALACAITKAGLILVTLNTGPLGLVLVDSTTSEQVARLRSGSLSEDVALDEVHNRAVVLNSVSEDLSVVPLGVAGKYRSIGLDWKPTRLAVSADGKTAYVTSRDSDRLQIIDLDQGRVLKTITLARQPTGVAILRDGSYVVMEAGAKILHLFPAQLPLTSSAQKTVAPASGAISGVVRDLAGRPVAAGTLQVEGRTIPVLADGSFLIAQLPAGHHEVTIRSPGFPELTVTVQAREGYIKNLEDIQLPPQLELNNTTGIGFLPDAPLYSDVLARQLLEQVKPRLKGHDLSLLTNAVGPSPEFKQFVPLLKDLSILDRDGRLSADLDKLKVVGRTLKLRYLIFTQVQSKRGYDTRGNALLNGALRLFIPFFPVEIPNFSPNQLRTQGLVIVLDLQKARIGDLATLWQASSQDETGGEPLFEEAADGLFRQEIIRLAQDIAQQWQTKNLFTEKG